MPILTETEIKAKIASGEISAISVDTAVFDKYHCNLGHAVIARLDQFKTGSVRFLLSEIVINEIKAHIAREATETQRTIRSALEKHHQRWKLGAALPALRADLTVDADPSLLAQQQVDAFLQTVGALVVAASGETNIATEVLRRYFEPAAPFEDKEKKKHEFPDAFALLSLEEAAAKSQTLMLCVSPDNGWAAYSEKSERLVVLKEIDVALSLFNESGRSVAEQVIARWKADQLPELISEVERAFEYFLESQSFHIESDSYLSSDSELLSAVLQSLNLATLDHLAVIAADDDQVTFSVKAQAIIGFTADFSFYVHDSIDREYVSMGSREAYVEEPLPFEITATVSREMIDEKFDVIDVEVTSPQKVVDFGYVHPFPDDDPTREKY